MSNPADSAPKAAQALSLGRLSPEDADRFAAMIRPSWELDDAPFTGPASLSESEMRALQGGGVRPEVRAALAVAPGGSSANGTHAPAVPRPPAGEPEDSVIIDRSITAADLAAKAPAAPAVAAIPTAVVAAPPAAVAVPVAAAAPAAAAPAAAAPAPAAPRLLDGRTILGGLSPVAPPAAAPAPAPGPVVAAPPAPEPQPAEDRTIPTPPPSSRGSRRPPAPSFDLKPPVHKAPARAVATASVPDAFVPKRSRGGLWIGLGVGGVLAVVVGIWTMSGSPEKPAAEPASQTKPTADRLSAVPPPPPETVAAPTPPLPPAAPATAPPTTTATAPPVAATPAPPPPRAAAPPPPPPPPRAAAPAPARPAPPPKKTGQTIVHDVPF